MIYNEMFCFSWSRYRSDVSVSIDQNVGQIYLLRLVTM